MIWLLAILGGSLLSSIVVFVMRYRGVRRMLRRVPDSQRFELIGRLSHADSVTRWCVDAWLRFEDRGHTREATKLHKAQTDRERLLAAILQHLDRCPHGRHAIDDCWSCPQGHSIGNPLLPEGARIGTTVHGNGIWMPPRGHCHEPAAWLTDPATSVLQPVDRRG